MKVCTPTTKQLPIMKNKTKLYSFVTLLLSAAIITAGCSQKEKVDRAAKSEGLKLESAHGSGSQTAGATDEGLSFTAPSGWTTETPSSSNRKAQYKLPRAEGDSEDAELVVSYFPGGGGTPQANVDRWIGQFTKPDGSPAGGAAKVTHRDISGIPLTIVDVSGNYSNSMMPMGQSQEPRANYRMLGAIAEMQNGPWFIKLTGPIKTVTKWASSFDAFLNSIRQK
jgi:hypothetical protein